jgi:hypothetical protein
MSGHVASTEEMTKTYKILVGISEEKRPLRIYRPTHRRKDNIKIDFKTGCKNEH